MARKLLKKKVTGQEEVIAQLKERFLEYYAKLPVLKYAAMSIARDEDTIIRWKREDTDFADRVQVAKAQWALERSKRVRAEFALERLDKDIWAERKEVEHSGEAGFILKVKQAPDARDTGAGTDQAADGGLDVPA